MMSCHRRQFLQLLASSAVLAAVPLGSIARTPALTAATPMGLPQLILSLLWRMSGCRPPPGARN